MTNSEIILYQNPDGNIKIDVRLEDETVWLTQEQMAMLFGKGRRNVEREIEEDKLGSQGSQLLWNASTLAGMMFSVQEE